MAIGEILVMRRWLDLPHQAAYSTCLGDFNQKFWRTLQSVPIDFCSASLLAPHPTHPFADVRPYITSMALHRKSKESGKNLTALTA